MKKLRTLIPYLDLRVLLTFCTIFFSSIILAQDKKVDVNIGVKGTSAWYQQPWAWVLGAAVFILLLVAILRSGKRDA